MNRYRYGVQTHSIPAAIHLLLDSIDGEVPRQLRADVRLHRFLERPST